MKTFHKNVATVEKLSQHKDKLAFAHLCNFFKILMPLLQSSGSMQRLANTCVFTEEGLPVVFYPVQHLYTHSERTLIKQCKDAILNLTTKGCI